MNYVAPLTWSPAWSHTRHVRACRAVVCYMSMKRGKSQTRILLMIGVAHQSLKYSELKHDRELIYNLEKLARRISFGLALFSETDHSEIQI